MTQRTPVSTKYPDLWARLQAGLRGFLSPGTPVDTVLAQGPDEDGAPRERLYTPAQNASPTPRQDEPALTPFATLRQLAANWDVAAICIHVLKQELMGLEWAIVPMDGSDKQAPIRLADPIKRVTAQLQRPDGDLLFDQWAAMLAGEDLEIGMPVVYRNRSKGGKLLSLDIIQGDTIKPLLDTRGKITGFQQVWMGIPGGIWDTNAILYAPRVRRRNSAYGEAPLERVLLAANVALRRQNFDLSYYTDGNLPEALAGTPPEWTPAQVGEFQAWFDSMFTGNDAARRKIKMWPGDPSKIHEFKQQSETTAQQEWLMKIGCAAFGVRPEEIGFTHGINRATAQVQAAGQQRTAVKPLAQWIEDILTTVIQQDLKQPELCFSYDLGGKTDDRYQNAQTDDLNIKNRIYGPATVRERDGIQLAPGDESLLTPPAPLGPDGLPVPPDGAPMLPPGDAAPVDESAPPPDDASAAPPDAAPAAPAGSNVLTLAVPLGDPAAMLSKLTGPGSRGGHFYLDANGKVHYGTPPTGAAAQRHQNAAQRHAAAQARHNAAVARHQTNAQRAAQRRAEAAQRKAARQAAAAQRHAMVLARQNGRDQLQGLHDLVDMRGAGWAVQSEAGYGADKAAANAAAQAAGAKDPKSLFATVKVNGEYYVVSKPIADLQGERAHNTVSGGSHKTDATTAANEASKPADAPPAEGKGSNAPPAASGPSAEQVSAAQAAVKGQPYEDLVQSGGWTDIQEEGQTSATSKADADKLVADKQAADPDRVYVAVPDSAQPSEYHIISKPVDKPSEATTGSGNKPKAASATLTDLRKWERKALARAKAGRRAACTFSSPAIPAPVAGTILTALTEAQTPDAIKAVFAPHLVRAQVPPRAKLAAQFQADIVQWLADTAQAAIDTLPDA